MPIQTQHVVPASREILQVVVDTERLQSDDAKRVKRVRATRDRILSAADRAVTVLCEIIEDSEAKNADRVSAARVLLQYSGVGEVHETEQNQRQPSQMTRSELVAHLDQMRAQITGAPQPARVIDATPTG